MTLHVDYVKHKLKKYGCTDYTFIDRHTSEEIAFGSYNNDGDFEIIGSMSVGVERYVSAAVAFVKLNRKLIDRYGY